MPFEIIQSEKNKAKIIKRVKKAHVNYGTLSKETIYVLLES